MPKVGTGYPRLKGHQFDLPCLIEGIVESKAKQVEAEDKQIELFIDPSMPVMVKGNGDCLKEILEKLIGFANKNSEPGGVSLYTEVKNETKSFSRVDFSILFIGKTSFHNPEQTIQASTVVGSDDLVSSGIDSDLYGSQQLLQQVGSTIQVLSIPGKESKISFQIKFWHNPNAKAYGLRGEFNGIRVLLIDKNPARQQLLTKMLSAFGCQVKKVSDSTEIVPALVRGLISNSPFKIIFLDWELGGLDIEGIMLKLRQEDMVKNLKFIILAPRNNQGLMIKLGLSNLLYMPVRWSNLRAVLQTSLDPVPALMHEITPLKTEKEPTSKKNIDLKILLVEDNEDNLKLGSILLGQLGYTVDVALGGSEAILEVETHNYDLVFMDIEMPGMSGLETTRRIRTLQSDNKDIPIIAMSAHDYSKYEQSCLDAGMNDYLSKPFNIKQITQIIKSYAAGVYQKNQKKPIEREPAIPYEDVPYLDMTVGMSIFNNDIKAFKDFLLDFTQGLPKRLEKMEVALNLKDWELLGNEAHNLKGISANLGVMRIFNLSAQLEVYSRERTEKPASVILIEIGKEIVDLKEQAPLVIAKLHNSPKIITDS